MPSISDGAHCPPAFAAISAASFRGMTTRGSEQSARTMSSDLQESADLLALKIGEWVKNPRKYLEDYIYLENLAKEDDR
jgi:hypothetical protein